MQTYGHSEALAQTFHLLDEKKDLKVSIAVCSLKLSGALKNEYKLKRSSLLFCSWKTLKTFYQAMEDGTLPECSLKWTKSGMIANGKFITLPTTSHKIESECILSDILEKKIQPKYFLGQDKVQLLIDNLKKINIVGNVKKPTQTSRGDRYIVLGNGLAPTLLATNYKAPLKILIHKRTHKIVQIGNTSASKSFGGNPTVGRTYSPGGIAPTLNTGGGGSRIPQIVTEDLAIRKLTPKECWRLQGFTDDQFDKAREAGLSDTQLYKQAGNAVSVPVVYDIAKKFPISL